MPARPRWPSADMPALALAFALASLLGACTFAPPAPPRPQTPNTLPGWAGDDLTALGDALARQCAMARPPAPWPQLCREAPSGPALRGWIADRFTAWPLNERDGDGLVTGYHEPVLNGSLRRESPQQVPLHGRPPDLQRGAGDAQRVRQSGGGTLPYWTRAQIENDGVLAGQELVWLDDPVEAFFLHVQGSGRIRLRDGTVLRVGYADHNGQPYRAIGRELIERGALQQGTVDADVIKRWLREHPTQAASVMQANPRYVFFRVLPAAPAEVGPPGSLGVPLTAGRSLATDPRFVPPGALMWIDTSRPDDGTPLRRLMISQDTGSAIVGAARADLFWGSTEEAARLAAAMKQPARSWLLWPSAAGVPPTLAQRLR